MAYSLEIINLTKEYPNFSLNNMNFSLQEGTIMGLIGENGAGKSTIIKSILNLISINNGNIKIFGMDHINEEEKIKQSIGVVFDECHFHDALNSMDLNIIFSKVYDNWSTVFYKHYLEQFHLPPKKQIKEYSRGMKMKLSIAVALSHQPKLLILDEPTSGLDPIVRNEILDVFLEYIQDEHHSILISSHITNDLERIADYITFIHQGSLLLNDSKDNLIYNHGLIKCGEQAYQSIDKQYIKGVRKNSFGYEVLVSNCSKIKKLYSNLIIDSPSLEEIMLYYSKEAYSC